VCSFGFESGKQEDRNPFLRSSVPDFFSRTKMREVARERADSNQESRKAGKPPLPFPPFLRS
jgi:hypothetical protein